jgi:hypothetical protein
MRREKCYPLLSLLVCAFLLGGTGGSSADQEVGASVGAGWISGDYVVLPFNSLGMHCYDNDFSNFSILPPFNVLNGQVIKRGSVPAIMSSNDVHLAYKGMRDPTGSLNTTSTQFMLKTNFWQYVPALFGVSLKPDQGLTGQLMPGRRNRSRPFLSFDAAMNWFSATGIPITNYDDSFNLNYYPLMRVTAFDNATGSSLGSSPVTLPVSAEAHCDVCHQTDSDAASPGFHGVPVWSQNSDPNIRTRENILILHDAINNTTLMAQRPVLCFTCHYSPALDLAGTGPTGTQINPATGQPYSWTSRAVHNHHGSVQLNGIPIPDEGVNTCYYCHPGTQTKCLRGAMGGVGLICQNCHGGLMAVASTNRVPWKDLPKCQSCHTGDAVLHLGDQIIGRLAYADSPDVATPIIAVNKLFAENGDPANPGQSLLFRNSMGHAGASGVPHLACPACHGSPHAEWPVADPGANDNLLPKKLQGYTGKITECSVCHGEGYSPPPGKLLNGPHGIHSVNDPNWWGVAQYNHKYFLLTYPTRIGECQACHGKNLEGTVLSKTSTNRVFTTGPMNNNEIALAGGVPVSCSICHSNPPVP